VAEIFARKTKPFPVEGLSFHSFPLSPCLSGLLNSSQHPKHAILPWESLPVPPMGLGLSCMGWWTSCWVIISFPFCLQTLQAQQSKPWKMLDSDFGWFRPSMA